MAPKLYMAEMSPPCRGVMLTIEALGISLEYVNINFMEKEHLKPDFVRKNPQHTVPTFEDGDFIVWDSHAIAAYLVTVYGKEDELLPKDPKQRAIVDQRLHFDSYLFERLRQALMPLWSGAATTIPKHLQDDIISSYGIMEIFLEKNDWLAGNRMTIADLSCISSVSTLDEFMPIDRQKYSRVAKWIERLEALPYYAKTNTRGSKAFGEIIRSKLKCCG